MHAACLVRRAVHGFGLPQSVDESYRWLVEGVHHALTATATAAPAADNG
ncbi:MAG: hypothetical protein M3386_06315 [Actinomycetota bacterium]|nr:hypothetical protein [Actinomycetota bacterium]